MNRFRVAGNEEEDEECRSEQSREEESVTIFRISLA